MYALLFLALAACQNPTAAELLRTDDAPEAIAKRQEQQYAEARFKAVAECKPFVVYVGCVERPVAGAVTARWDGFRFANETFPAPSVVCSGMFDGDLWHTRTLPGSATTTEIAGYCNVARLFRQTPPPPMAWQPIGYQQMFGGCPGGNCANGQCQPSTGGLFRRR